MSYDIFDGNQEQASLRWEVRDSIFLKFYSIVHAGCFSNDINERFLRSKTGEIYMTLEQRAPFRAQFEEAGLSDQIIEARILHLLEPLNDREVAVVALCLGLNKHHIPTLQEAAVELSMEPSGIDDVLNRFSSLLDTQ